MGGTMLINNFNIRVMVTGRVSDPKLKCAFIAMFEVQIVRQRKGVSGGLQALRRRFTMVVNNRGLKISIGSAVRDLAVISISQNRIKSVRVRGRLLRVVVDKGDFLTVRLQDREEALRAAESMMETWSIDPLVEDSEVSAAEMEEVDCGVEGLVKHYMDDPTFRQLVHDIHDQIDTILAKNCLM